MGATFSQFFPPTPGLTEANLPSQSGKVFIVTGGTSGVGYQLASILYHAGGTVYVAVRSESRALAAISAIEATEPSPTANLTHSRGKLHYLHLDLSNLSTIRASAATFLSKSPTLNVLFNNAAISLPPAGSLTPQSHELTLATNLLGPYLFTTLLLPVLHTTAASPTTPRNTTRIVFLSSIVVDFSPPKGGLTAPTLDAALTTPSHNMQQNYEMSKTGNYFLATEFARRCADTGIVSVTANPGNLKTDLLRHTNGWLEFFVSPILYHAKYGAYTELWAGLAPEVQQGGYVVPFGRMHPAMREDLVAATGKGGIAQEVWDWCEGVVGGYR